MKNLLLTTWLLFTAVLPITLNGQCVSSSAPSGVSGTLSICNGSTTSLTVSGGTLGTGAQWKWYTGSCGGTLIDSGAVITVSPTTTKAYWVRAEGGSCSSTTACATATVTVNAVPAAPTKSIDDSTVCSGVAAGLRGYSVGNTIFWYTQSSGGSAVDSTASHSYYWPIMDTSIVYYIEAKSSAGCVSATRTALPVTALPVPPAPNAPTSNSPNCGQVTLTRVGTPPSGQTWYFGSGFNMTIHNGNHGSTYVVTSSGTYYIHSRYDATGCWGLDTVTISVVVKPRPAAPDSIYSNSPQCQGTGVTLTVVGSAPAGQTWYWQPRTVRYYTTDTGATYTVASTSVPCIKSLDTVGCWSDDKCIGATVNPRPAVPTAATPSTATNVCSGANLIISATSTGNSIDWYTQSSGGSLLGSAASGAGFTVNPTTGGAFYAASHSAAGCVSSSRKATGVISILSLPAAPTAPASQSICSDTAYTFVFDSVLAGSGGNQIEWSRYSSFDSSTIVSSGNDIYFTVNAGETDTLWLRSRASATGCVSAGVGVSGKVNLRPEAPTAPAPQSVASDTAYDFVFENVKAGFGGNQIEWALGSSFISAHTDSNLCRIAFTVDVDSFAMVWLRSMDSVTGCVSEVRTTIGIVDSSLLQEPPSLTIKNICLGTALDINLPNTDAGKFYELKSEGIVVTSAYGNGSVLILNSGNIDSIVKIEIWETDTTQIPISSIDSIFWIEPVAVTDTPVFEAMSPLIYVNDSTSFYAYAENAARIIYSIESGGAEVDSISGLVKNVTDDFTIRATAYGFTGCGTAYTDYNLYVTDVALPVYEKTKIVVVDSPQIVTVTIDSILAGTGGNQIEWSTSKDFSNYQRVNSPATINIDLATRSDTLIWIRSRNERSGSRGNGTPIHVQVMVRLLSAGLLDKSKWDYDGFNSDEFGYSSPEPKDQVNSTFRDKWALNFCWADGNNPCNENCIGNHAIIHKNSSIPVTYFAGSAEFSNTGRDGSGNEVTFYQGNAEFTATKLTTDYHPFADYAPIPNVCSANDFNGISYKYKSGLISSRRFLVNPSEPALFELRCKGPSNVGAWPAFWLFGGSNEFDIFENGTWYEGQMAKTMSTIHDISDSAKNNNAWHDYYDGTYAVNCGQQFWKLTPCNYGEDWHTYTMYLSTSEIIFFVDGKETWSTNRSNTGYPVNLSSTNTNPNLMRVIIGMAVNDLSQSDEYKLYVDYFRHYTPKLSNGNPVVCLQNIYNGNALTLESPSFSPITVNNTEIPISNSIDYTTHSIPPQRIGLLSSGQSVKVFYKDLASTSSCYYATYQNNNWIEKKINPMGGNLSIVKDFITPKNDNLIYFQSTSSKLRYYKKQFGYGFWEEFAACKNNNPQSPISNCAGYINLDNQGRVWYKGSNNKLCCWVPGNGTWSDITMNNATTNSALVIAKCGCLAFYTDGNNKLRQMYWWNSWHELPNPVTSQTVSANNFVLDEQHSRVFFIGTDQTIYYYTWNYDTVNPNGLDKLGHSTCANNAASDLTISPDGNYVYYKATDGKIWYYFHDFDTELNGVHWNQTMLNDMFIQGGIVQENTSKGRLFYVNNNQKLSVADWVNADNMLDCPYDNGDNAGRQYGAYKTDGDDTVRTNTVEEPTENEIKLAKTKPFNLTIYPNPSTSNYTFYFDGLYNENYLNIRINNVHGETVFEKHCSLSSEQNYYSYNISGEKLSSGIYFYEILLSSGMHANGKLFKTD
ncbi:MAG: T9SS type A sorting domain-containing protein [Chitinophagales bacterium]